MKADPKRKDLANATGIYVRALRDGKWDSVDIAELDKLSLEEWLKDLSKEELIRVIEIIFGH